MHNKNKVNNFKIVLSKMIEDMIELTTLPLFPNKTLEKSEYELIHS